MVSERRKCHTTLSKKASAAANNIFVVMSIDHAIPIIAHMLFCSVSFAFLGLPSLV